MQDVLTEAGLDLNSVNAAPTAVCLVVNKCQSAGLQSASSGNGFLERWYPLVLS